MADETQQAVGAVMEQVMGEQPVVDASVEAETPVEAAPPPAAPEPAKDLEIARRFEAARQAEMKARRTTLAAQQREKDIAEREAKLVAREQALKEDEELLANDPLAWTDRRKVDPDNLAKRYLQPKTPAERELEALKARLDAQDAEKKTAAEKAEQDAAAAQQHGRMRTFVSEITPDECPNLTSMYDAEQVPALVQRALERHGEQFQTEYGRAPTNGELRAFLEGEASERAKKILERQQAAASASGKDGSGQLETGSGHQASNGPQTLTNHHAAQTASGSPRPKTREESRAALIAQLEAEDRAARVH